MRDRLIFAGQLAFTALVAAFLVVPALLSISAGITVSYFRGIQSGVTLQWIVQVWELYAGTILLSFLVAFSTLAVTLVAGVPAFAFEIKTFFLLCVIVAGVYGAATVSRRILWVQAAPAALALILLWLA